MPNSELLHESARETPVVHDCDLCVIGGSCTGVFAAVRAARLGAKVAIIEADAAFGGVATRAYVNVWHSIYDATHQRQIIAGLTTELMDRLRRRDAVREQDPNNRGQMQFSFNPAEMSIELDELIRESGVRPYLHTRFVQPVMEDGWMRAAIIENKSGRLAIRARCFIDATGDADVVHRAGLETHKARHIQPPTMCALIHGLKAFREHHPDVKVADAVFDPAYAEALPGGFFWTAPVPGQGPDVVMVAGTRVHGVDCSDADQLTAAEMEGRRQVRAMVDVLRNNFEHGKAVSLAALPPRLGTRESRHAACHHRLTEAEVLAGTTFPDGIANSCYRVDIHHTDTGGNTFRWLDGREFITCPGKPTVERRWREPVDQEPTFYQLPYRSILPRGAKNLIVAGRILDADRGAFSAVRVMQNCNQTGEAAGVASWLAMDANTTVDQIDPAALRRTLSAGGSLIL